MAAGFRLTFIHGLLQRLLFEDDLIQGIAVEGDGGVGILNDSEVSVKPVAIQR